MMERILMFLPDILALAGVTVFSLLAKKIIIGKLGKSNINSVAWMKENIQDRLLIIAIILGILSGFASFGLIFFGADGRRF